MKFTHLPCAGGLYDQHPALLDDWFVIMGKESEAELQRQSERNNKNKAQFRPRTTGR